MNYLNKLLESREQLASSLVLAVAVLLAAWLGSTNGGYFVGDRAPVAFILAALVLLTSVSGVLGRAQFSWSVAAPSLLTVRRGLCRELAETGDWLAPNYVHFFTRDEVASELSEGGFKIIRYGTDEYGHAVGTAV